jgi:hypothetical protein
MSRTLYLSLDEGKVVACCLKEKVGISAIERLPGGGVRLVCMGVDGAERIRSVLKKQLLEEGDISREPHRPSTPLW